MKKISVKPQDRDVKGKVVFTDQFGNKEELSKAYTLPQKECESCRFYSVKALYNPIGYYCNSGMFSNRVRIDAKKDGQRPKECVVEI